MTSFSISNSLSKLSITEDILPKREDALSNEQIGKDTQLEGGYRVISEPIEGGMGSVWRVEETASGKVLCMKRPLPKYFAEGGAARKEMFIRECESWIGLGLHPLVVPCYYVREIGGVPTIFSEWMEGGSLADRIADGSLYAGTEEEKQQRILQIAIRFARGLSYAHSSGLIHRDVKPDNVLLTADMKAQVADFGLSGAYEAFRAEEQAEKKTELTNGDAPGTILVGSGGYSPAYCSPEQAARKDLTRRTDIYSWAVSMLEVYAGGLRWKTGPEAGLRCDEILAETEMKLPEGMAELLKRCLNPEESDRPHDFAEVDSELLSIHYRVFNQFFVEPDDAAPASADSLNNMAVSYMEIGREDRARRNWVKAGETDPGHAETLYNRALDEWRTGRRTDLEIQQQLKAHPFFTDTGAGKRAMSALAQESGKASPDEPLTGGAFSWDADWKTEVHRLYRGRLYALSCREALLREVDPETRRELARHEFFRMLDLENRKIAGAGLSPDCSTAVIHLTDGTLAVYDIASHMIIRELLLPSLPRYDVINYLELFGSGRRILLRSISHMQGHGTPPSFELYDLRTGKLLEEDYRRYRPWELVRLDGEEGNEAPNPMHPAYRNSFTDGIYTVTVYTDGVSMKYCDDELNPIMPVPAALAERIADINSLDLNRDCIRITKDGRVWLLRDNTVYEFNLVTGKCLRSFAERGRRGDILVDSDGLGILTIGMADREREEADGSLWNEEYDFYRYRKMIPVLEEDRAPYLFSEPENFSEYAKRKQQLNNLRFRFDRAEEKKDTSAMCAVYAEASCIRRFPGSAAQQEMARRLNTRARQREGELIPIAVVRVPSGEDARKRLLASYGAWNPLEKMMLEKRNRLEKATNVGIPPICVSRDGKHGLITPPRPMLPGEQEGPGVFLADFETDKVYLIPNSSGPMWKSAVFRCDGLHILHGSYSGKTGTCRFDGSEETEEDAIFWDAVRKKDHWLMGANRQPAEPPMILWENGVYVFRTEEDRNAFLAQDGMYMHILEANEEYGLIAFKVSLKSENRLRVWSVDERRLLLDRFLPVGLTNAEARFSRSTEEPLRLLIAERGVIEMQAKGPVKAEIYQFRSSYEAEENRRVPAGSLPVWPPIMLKPWRPGVGKANDQSSREEELNRKAAQLAREKNPESCAEAYGICCELVRSFPGNGNHRRNLDAMENNLKYFVQQMAQAGDAVGMEKILRTLKYRRLQFPAEEKTSGLVCYTQEHLAHMLSERDSMTDLRRAQELYEELEEWQEKKQPLLHRNSVIVGAKIMMMEREEKKQAKDTQGKKSLFSFLRKK